MVESCVLAKLSTAGSGHEQGEELGTAEADFIFVLSDSELSSLKASFLQTTAVPEVRLGTRCCFTSSQQL